MTSRDDCSYQVFCILLCSMIFGLFEDLLFVKGRAEWVHFAWCIRGLQGTPERRVGRHRDFCKRRMLGGLVVGKVAEADVRWLWLRHEMPCILLWRVCEWVPPSLGGVEWRDDGGSFSEARGSRTGEVTAGQGTRVRVRPKRHKCCSCFLFVTALGVTLRWIGIQWRYLMLIVILVVRHAILDTAGAKRYIYRTVPAELAEEECWK